ncbi:MAG: RNA polymerase subunit sigma-24 [Pseudonocardiales bacterium]|nr:MAG: RNA polymerase subunit sigma-24 [Pseudonocardiales bacterium]
MTLAPFEAVVLEHGPVVLRVCRAVLGPQDAEDAWSETFLAALKAYPDIRADSNVRAWLVTIAHRKAIDRHRSIRRAPIPTDRLPDRAATDDEVGRLPDESLADAVMALPDKQRAAVSYRYLADLSYRTIGELIGSSEAAARRSAADGIAKLRSTYQQEEISS